MIDIKLNNQDIEFLGGDIATTDTIATSYMISIFSDAGFYWADLFESNHTTGSDLHTLSNEAMTEKTPSKARRMILNSTDWLKSSGVISSQDVEVWRDNIRLNFAADVFLSTGASLNFGGNI